MQHPEYKNHEVQPLIDPLRDLIETVLDYGDSVPDRTGTGTLEMFATFLHYSLLENVFPLCTLKKTSFKAVLAETLWLISGQDKLDMMHAADARHWDPWLPEDACFGAGSLGRVYGVQWRHWRTGQEVARVGDVVFHGIPKYTDQLKELVDGLRTNPHGRRHIVTCWNPGELDQMALPPCHVLWQVHVDSDGYLSLQVYQRSVDLFIGCPYDVGIYSLILRMLCVILKLKPGRLSFAFGSTHIYKNHVAQAEEFISRKHLLFPTLTIADKGQKYLEDFLPSDFTLEGYHPHPFIKAPVAV